MFKTRKAVFQAILLIAGAAMVGVGALRGEVDIVLSKAIRLCLECVGIGSVSYTHLDVYKRQMETRWSLLVGYFSVTMSSQATHRAALAFR